MKKVILILALILLIVAISGCDEIICQHNVAEWVVITPATCFSVGEEAYTCLDCSAILDKHIVEKIDHNMVENVVAPTPEQDGYTLHQCANCTHSYKDTYVTYQSVCKHSTCQWFVVTESSCEKDGLEQYACTLCKLVFDERVIPAMGHADATWTTSTPATCEKDGLEQNVCSRCNVIFDERTISAIGHDYQKMVHMPTFDQTGYTYNSCSRCSDVFIDSKIENLVNLNYSVSDGKNIMTITAEQSVHLNLSHILHTESFSVTGQIVANDLVDELILADNIVSASSVSVLSGLKKVTFGSQIQKIGERCVYDCQSLREIYFLGDEPTIHRESLLVNGGGMLSIYVNDDAVGFDDLLFGGHRVVNNIPEATGDTSITLQEYSKKATIATTNLIKRIMDLSEQRNQKLLMLLPYENVAYYKDIKDFTLNLTKDCLTERDKISAIYNYLITNVIYDDNALEYSPIDVLTTKRAVCFGYVTLMHDMLCSLGIPSFYVRGATLSSVDASTEYLLENWYDFESGHAWLGVYMEDESVLYFDPTWGVETNNCDFMDEQRVSQYTVPIQVQGLSVIMEDYVFSMYKKQVRFLHDDGFIYGAVDGVTSSSAANLVLNYALYFGTPRVTADGSENISGFEQPLETFWNSGFVLSSPDADRYFGGNFYRVDGVRYTIDDVYEFINIENKYYGANCDLGLDKFVLHNDCLYYKIDDYLTLISYLGTEKDVTIPGEVDGLQVKVIGQDAFERNVFVENIVLGEGVEIIEGGAFFHNENLKTVIIPASVHTICKEDNRYSNSTMLFDKCEQLQQIIVSENNAHFASYNGSLYSKDLTVLYEGANKASSTFEFSANIAEIKNYALAFSCFEQIVIPANVQIGDGAFYNCFYLKKVTICDGITEIGNHAFAYCQNLQEVRLPNTLKILSDYLFNESYSLFTLDIPESVTTIGYSAFLNSGIISITLPQNISLIEPTAFWGCNQLLEIINLSELPLEIGSENHEQIALNAINIFDNVSKSKLVIENDFVLYEDYVLAYLGNDTVLRLPEGYRLLDNTFGCNDVVAWQTSGSTFYLWYVDNYHRYHEITHIVFSKDVTEIGEYSFYSFINLEEITVTANLINIEKEVFVNSKLAVVNFVGTQEQFNNHPLRDYYMQYEVNIVSE